MNKYAETQLLNLEANISKAIHTAVLNDMNDNIMLTDTVVNDLMTRIITDTTNTMSLVSKQLGVECVMSNYEYIQKYQNDGVIEGFDKLSGIKCTFVLLSEPLQGKICKIFFDDGDDFEDMLVDVATLNTRFRNVKLKF